MNEYIFYTTEGFTTSPNEDIEVDNCQVLGRVKAKDVQQAKKALLQENTWIESAGFNLSRVTALQILTDKQKFDISTVVDYLWTDEERHFDESERPDNHIFRVLKRLRELCK